MQVQNSTIADIFYKIADLLQIEGANPFRIRAYRDAARTIENYPRRIYQMVEDSERVEEISGVGEDLAKKIIEIATTGNLEFYETLRNRTPESLLQLLDVSGLGPKRVKQLYEELSVTNLEALRAALKSGKVADLDGFGQKTVTNILEALKSESLPDKRTRLDVAEQFVKPLISFLESIDSVETAIVAGSFRRRKSTVGDLDIIAISQEGKQVSEAFVSYESVDKILSQGETKSSVKLRSGLQVDLRVVPQKSYGSALLYFTGSKAHNIKLRNIAVDNGYKINEYGVFKGDNRILGEAEKEIYRHFDMPYIVPELREDTGEIEAAQKGGLPELLELNDIRGDLQMHTTASDGKNTIKEMAEAAEQLGYEYIAITDHTSYIGVTQGLNEDEVDQYIQQIDSINENNKGITILKGIEVDIKKDGQLDWSDKTLKKMDIVLGSIHSYFDLDEKAQTQRVIHAMNNAYLNILAHPTTRRIGTRDPIKLDLEKIMDAALENNCFLEVNANPERLDLSDRFIRMAKKLGQKLVISTDAHRKDNLNDMKYGVDQARRGWADKQQILNTLPLADLLKQLHRD